MAVSLASIRSGASIKAARIMAYGVHGIGKTSLAAGAPNPIFLQTEDGLGLIDAPSFGLLRSFDEVMDAIGVLYTEDHDYKTVVVDSLDWMEPLVWVQVSKDNGWKDIETPGYGKGYVAALDAWRAFLDGLNALRDEKGMTVIMIAHSEIKRFDSPEHEPFDRYQPKLHSRASALIQEHADCVLFANWRVSTVKTDAGFNKKVTRGVGGGDRLLHTTERPAFLAKNRYAMPDSIPLEWDAIAAHIPFYSQSENQTKTQPATEMETV